MYVVGVSGNGCVGMSRLAGLVRCGQQPFCVGGLINDICTTLAQA